MGHQSHVGRGPHGARYVVTNILLRCAVQPWRINPGFCIACGEEAMSCEPDARCYGCEHCGKSTVFGAAELLFMLE
jgi:hypothetical protein